MAMFVYTAEAIQSWKPVGMIYDTFDPTVCDDPRYSTKCTDDFLWPDGTTGLANKPVSTVPKKKTCQPGLYINSEGVCTKCPTGSKLEAAGPHTRTECEICPAGTYAPATGMTECLGCDSVSGYQPEVGKDSCLLCPANSYRVIGSDPTNDEGCMCMAGYYQVRENGNLKCSECPFGMECLGEKYKPFAKPGYYAISDLEAMFCLRNTAACAGGGLVGAKTNDSSTAKIDVTRCAGNFVGNMCSQCESGYFNVGNTCAECTGGGGVIAFWIAILVFIIGSSQVGRYIMVSSNKSLQKAALGFAVLVMLPSFKVLVAFFQMMALLVMTEGISWPRQALDAISWTDFFNVDTGVLQVPCVFKDIATDELQRKIVLSLPWFSIVVVILAVIISAAVAASKGQAAFGEFITLYFKSLFSGNKTRVPEAAVGLSSVADALVALFVMFSWIVYLPVMIETVSLLTCSTFGNLTTKRSFVLSYPYIECTAGNPAFDEVRTWGLGCLFCYGFGIPAILYAMLRTSKGNFTDPAVYRRLAPAFFEYKPEFRYYQLVIMLRLFALSMCATLASTKLRLYYFSVIIILTIASHMYFQPYNTTVLNVMETTALLTLGLVAQVAYVFISEELVESTQTDSIGVFLAVLLVVCILLIITTFVMDFKAAYRNAVIRLAVTDQDETTASTTLFPATESSGAISGKEAIAVMNMVKFHFQRCETNQTSSLSGDDSTLRGTAAGLAIETGATGVLGPRGTAALGGAKCALADSMLTQQFFDEVMSHSASYPLCMSEMLKPEVAEGVLQSLVYSDDADRKAIIETMQSLGSMLSALAEDGAATEVVSKTTGVSGVNKDVIPSVLDFMQFCGSADQTASLIESIKSRCQGADAVKKNSKVSPGV